VKLTSLQEAAVLTEGRALLVEAGAGTGKTAVLVQRFLRVLETHPDWPIDSIVAVTFTEKATREMRSRLRAAVEARAAQEDAGFLWQERRRQLDRLAVSTIHGLCARLLRENPIAAGVDPRFNVLGEAETALLREEAVRQVLAELGAGVRKPAWGSADPLELLRSFEINDLHEQMAGLLGQRGTAERLFERLDDKDSLLAFWRVKVCEMQTAIWTEHLARRPETAEALEEIARLQVVDRNDRLAEHVRNAQDGCACAQRGELCAAAATFSGIKINVGRAEAWGGKDGLAAVKAWLKAARELSDCLTKKGYHEPVGENDAQAARALQCWRALWEEVTATYDAMKAELRGLDFDDLERLTWRLLTAKPRDERTQTAIDGINHLMVDEFQDVNELQGEILRALADMGAGGKFFAVGDAKQSIYRFRQAQVKVFNEAAREVLARTGHGPLPLSCSFRTHASLLAALNAGFNSIFSPVGLEYADFEARPASLEAERQPLEPCDTAPAPVEIHALPHGLADETRRLEATLLARRLRELVRQQFRVWDKTARAFRAVRFDDMAILYRATTSLPLYEEVFKAEGLPYITVSGRGYFDRPEVRDLTALLACLVNPADDLNLAVVLRSPMFSLSDDTLYRLRWFASDGSRAETPVAFSAALERALAAPHGCAQDEDIAFAALTLAELRSTTGRLDVWALLRLALDRTGYEATLALADQAAETGGGRARGNVAKFLQLARDWGGANLSAFLRSISDLREREAREGEALPDQPDTGAAQVMSIHAAKGLDFPVVALADLGRTPRGGKTARILRDPAYGLACQVRDTQGDWATPASFRWAEWLDGRMEQAESKRLLYVACTRAADLLILSGNPKAEDTWLKALADAWDTRDQVERNGDGLDVGEELIQRERYNLRIVRHAPLAEEDALPALPRATSPEPAPLLDTLPPLARALPVSPTTWPVAVTHIPSSRETEDDRLERPRPVVRMENGYVAGLKPWRFLIGNLAHRALADWECLALPEAELLENLTRWARRSGLTAPRDAHAAVKRAAAQLRVLRDTPLYREVCSARERYTEVPLSIAAGGRMLHGVLDLLYGDAAGEWRLLDWKTEWVPRGQALADAAGGETIRQLAIYRHAVDQILGIRAVAEVCFLGAGAQVYRPPAEQLAEAWARLVDEG
jgi:ATP-dependent helicase/nuclease subunit A